MFDALTNLVDVVAIAAVIAFVGTLAVGLVSIFTTIVRLGAGASSQIRRMNFVWFWRRHRVFWAMYGVMLLYALLDGFRPQ